ncbi:MAG: DUF177 domain-containing protein [Chloroflexota bacterium]
MPIADDLATASPVRGSVRLASTGRGILARGHLTYRAVPRDMQSLPGRGHPPVEYIEEEALPSIDIDTGVPLERMSEPDALRLDDHHELDLSEVARAVCGADRILCRPDCRGLCLTQGADLNADPSHSHDATELDPRLAALAAFRDRLDEAPGRRHHPARPRRVGARHDPTRRVRTWVSRSVASRMRDRASVARITR